jgi:hypothetical protein
MLTMTGRLISACSHQCIRGFDLENKSKNRKNEAARMSSSDDDDSDSALAHSSEMGHRSPIHRKGIFMANYRLRLCENQQWRSRPEER